MDIQTYIKPELLILTPVLYIIGMMIKKTRIIFDRYIPSVLGFCGIAFSLIWVISTEGLNGVSVFTAITQGILVAGAAVYANQLIKQAGGGKDGNT